MAADFHFKYIIVIIHDKLVDYIKNYNIKSWYYIKLVTLQ